LKYKAGSEEITVIPKQLRHRRGLLEVDEVEEAIRELALL